MNDVEDRAFDGVQGVYKHRSAATGTDMMFSVYVPPHAEGATLPVVWYLSGLTCTHANVMEKGEYREAAARHGVIIVCLDTCDPLAQSCPENQICFFDGVDTFICDFDASGDEGQYGDPCAFINVCDYGLFCATQESVPDCASTDGCCSPFCNTMEPNTCPGAPAQECVPWYAEGQVPPPGQENIGACAVPV